MLFLNRARKGFQSINRRPAGGVGHAIASGRSWSREAGLRYDNSVVFAAVMFACHALTEVDLVVRRPGRDGAMREVPNHPILELLHNPNPWYDLATLISGWVISELASPGGCSYTYKHRSPAGKLIGLEYVPHFAVSASPDGYLLSTGNGPTAVPRTDILQQRFGPLDPLRPEVSYGPLNAALLEVASDKQAANYTAALLANVGVTPHLITPGRLPDGTDLIFDRAQIQQIQMAFEEKITGDNRGRPLVAPLPLEVKSLSFSPNDMNLDAIRNISEERICAVLRIPPAALYVGTGLEHQNNRASAEAAAKAAARAFTKPYMRRKARELTRDLVPELGRPGDEVCFRVDQIEALQEDKTEAAKRDVAELAFMTVNEKRRERGLPPLMGGDALRHAPVNGEP